MTLEKRLAFLAAAILSVGIFQLLTELGSGSNAVTGLAVYQTSSDSSDNCYDTDNKDYYVQGTTYATILAVNNDKAKEDFCQGNTLVEYYCSEIGLDVVFYECAKGCRNGACLY